MEAQYPEPGKVFNMLHTYAKVVLMFYDVHCHIHRITVQCTHLSDSCTLTWERGGGGLALPCHQNMKVIPAQGIGC